MISQFPYSTLKSHQVQASRWCICFVVLISSLTMLVLCISLFSVANVEATAITERNSISGILTTTIELNATWASDEFGASESVAWGDLDGDGDLDLAIGNSDQPNRLYANDGNGELSLIWQEPLTDTRVTWAVAWGDLDGDGDLDLVVGNHTSANQIYFNLGGSFLIEEIYSDPQDVNRTRDLALGDMDGDSDLDLAVANSSTPMPQENQVYENINGIFIRKWSSGAVRENSYSVAWGDANGDGDLDLVFGNVGEPNRIYENDGDGNFNASFQIGDSKQTRSVAWGDINNDGLLDLVFGNGGETGEGDGQPNEVYLNLGGAFSLAWTSPDATVTWDVAWGDINEDGYLDIVVANAGDRDPGVNQIFTNDQANGFQLAWASVGDEKESRSIALGDMDSDGDLDLAIGNHNETNQLYRNDSLTALFRDAGAWMLTGTYSSRAVAWGDIDEDGDLDLAIANSGAANQVFRNDGALGFSLCWESTDALDTSSVAFGDFDGDRDLDLVFGRHGGTGPGQVNKIFENEGLCDFQEREILPSLDPTHTTEVAWGDINRDGHLDLAVANAFEPTQIFLNEGQENFSLQWESPYLLRTTAMALGDMDGDGDLDLAVGDAEDESNQIFRNIGGGSFELFWESPDPIKIASSMAWGDMDGDGDLDLAVGNWGQSNQVFRNDGADFTLTWSSGGDAMRTESIAWGDVDGDGDQDLLIANWEWNQVYRNQGGGDFALAWISDDEDGRSYGGAWGDVDNDGDLDAVFVNDGPLGSDDGSENQVYINNGQNEEQLPNNYPSVVIELPQGVADGNLFATARILQESVIPISYTLSDPENNPAAGIALFYSLNGGGQWHRAVATSDTITTNLPADTAVHHYFWDTWKSGLFGQSDNVVLRLVVSPTLPMPIIEGTLGYSNSVPGPFMWPNTSVATFPFRVRGTQVQVYRETITSNVELEDAIVYRMPAGQTIGAEPMANPQNNQTWHTDSEGFLQGHGELWPGDQIMALYPVMKIADTGSYTLYHTSAPVTATGLDMHTVTAPGVQTLTVSAENKLIVFDLDISLEWDASNDTTFLDQLQFDVQRASQILFDLTNGQVAVGQVRVYQNKENWNHSHVTIMAANNLHPGAILGGIVMEPTDDISGTQVIENAYLPGQIRMPPTWNRFGDPGGTVGEDWPRVLAHELGHFLLYMPDNYLGLADNNLLTLVDCKGSAMTNPYTDAYSEFLTRTEWDQEPECLMTLAERYLGRSDWQTINQFYPTLNGSTVISGPSNLPLALTSVQFMPVTPTNGLLDPFFSLVDQNGAPLPLPGGKGHGYLIKSGEPITTSDDRLLYLGTAVGDLVHARGAAPGDELCIFDFSVQPRRQGCTIVGSVAGSITLEELPNWNPQITVDALTANTFVVTVTNLEDGDYRWQLIPTMGRASEEQSQTVSNGIGGFTATVTLLDPAYAGYIRLWMPNATPNRMAIGEFLDLSEWDALVDEWGSANMLWGGRAIAWGGWTMAWGAPILSTDGQVMVFTLENLFDHSGEYNLQTLPFPPNLPSWLTPIGNSYHVSIEEDEFLNSSILFHYIGRDVPAGYENNLAIYFLPEEEMNWRRLATELDIYHNHASAAMEEEAGTYALMATVQVTPFVPGWNNFGYPIQGSKLVTEALVSIEGFYTSVYEYVPTQAPPWILYDTTVITPFQPLVNDLEELQFTHAYWIYATDYVTLYLGVEGDVSMQPGASEAFQLPPATYYGWLTPTAMFTPTAGMPVTAEIGGVICGTTTVKQFGNTDQLYYVLQAKADNIIDPPDGCGMVGRTVSFRVGEHLMDVDRPWANSQAWYHPLMAVMEPIDGLTATNSGPTPLGSPTYFTATVTAGTYVSYIWDFGDGSNGTGDNTSHTYAAAGTYVVEVTAFNDINAVVASTEVLVEIPRYNTFLPIVLKGSGGVVNVLLLTSLPPDSLEMPGERPVVALVTAGWTLYSPSRMSGRRPSKTRNRETPLV